MPSRLLFVVSLLVLSSCVTAKATQFATPKERVTECQDICTGVGMKLTALVVIMNSSGCVCEPANASTAASGGGAASGGAVIAATADAMARQQRGHQ